MEFNRYVEFKVDWNIFSNIYFDMYNWYVFFFALSKRMMIYIFILMKIW